MVLVEKFALLTQTLQHMNAPIHLKKLRYTSKSNSVWTSEHIDSTRLISEYMCLCVKVAPGKNYCEHFFHYFLEETSWS